VIANTVSVWHCMEYSNIPGTVCKFNLNFQQKKKEKLISLFIILVNLLTFFFEVAGNYQLFCIDKRNYLQQPWPSDHRLQLCNLVQHGLTSYYNHCYNHKVNKTASSAVNSTAAFLSQCILSV
jgi:hypothetical protein